MRLFIYPFLVLVMLLHTAMAAAWQTTGPNQGPFARTIYVQALAVVEAPVWTIAHARVLSVTHPPCSRVPPPLE